jgi:methionyl-tRNA synthetase
MPATAEQLWLALNLQGSVHKAHWTDAVTPLQKAHKINIAKPLFNKIDDDAQKLDKKLALIRENKNPIVPQ